ncbi:hypothetical protein RAA17_12510 [Komagataeibacter rhaeticus]|nr:hypothetical protein [Komagataeibacter rhaeticus]
MDDLVHGRSADPFSILGRHNMGKVDVIRVMYHDAARVRLVVERPVVAKWNAPCGAWAIRGCMSAPLPRGHAII